MPDNEDFCRRCGRPYEDEDYKVIEFDKNEVLDYIQDTLLSDGLIAAKDEIENVLNLYFEYLYTKGLEE